MSGPKLHVDVKLLRESKYYHDDMLQEKRAIDRIRNYDSETIAEALKCFGGCFHRDSEGNKAWVETDMIGYTQESHVPTNYSTTGSLLPNTLSAFPHARDSSVYVLHPLAKEYHDLYASLPPSHRMEQEQYMKNIVLAFEEAIAAARAACAKRLRTNDNAEWISGNTQRESTRARTKVSGHGIRTFIKE